MRFAMSYSCGKDSTLALDRMISGGNECVALVIVMNSAQGRSYFHGADEKVLERYEDALGIPLIKCPSDGYDYHLAIEKGFLRAKEMGAEAVCFGDIDIEGNRAWAEERCVNAGLSSVFPLWHRNREENVKDIIEKGYRCVIKSINNTLLPKDLLGRYVDDDSVRIMKDAGIDICGENGEYHTLAEDGPLFRKSMGFIRGEILTFGDFSVIDIQ